MSREEIGKNVMAAINGIADIVPRKWGGVRSFHLKLLDSLALPVYQAVPDLKMKIDGGPKEEENEKGLVAVEEEKAKEGRVEKKKGKNTRGDIDNDDADFEKVSGELLKKKRKKGDIKGKRLVHVMDIGVLGWAWEMDMGVLGWVYPVKCCCLENSP
ncbi:hypothetical protein OIU78_030419 [Salix suchowensis]|nr:hypothetical protein OIU78_030419 [Salix suchowensis]